ncbi:hypothetical protein N0V90_006587 [Kalmusia sp. IMI 367209]|nr:hypothetical protein N0V90_006587 [Kalmusia sp. IMI 367209]
MEEVDVVMKVVAAGVWWVAGIDVDKKGDNRRDSGADIEAQRMSAIPAERMGADRKAWRIWQEELERVVN